MIGNQRFGNARSPSNIGSVHLLEGITSSGEIPEDARGRVMSDLRGHFRPEFLNRVDEIVLFKPLTMAEIRQHFAQLQVAKFKWPERIEHLAEMPRTLVGKTDKKRLRSEIAAKIAAERAASQPQPATAGGTP